MSQTQFPPKINSLQDLAIFLKEDFKNDFLRGKTLNPSFIYLDYDKLASKINPIDLENELDKYLNSYAESRTFIPNVYVYWVKLSSEEKKISKEYFIILNHITKRGYLFRDKYHSLFTWLNDPEQAIAYRIAVKYNLRNRYESYYDKYNNLIIDFPVTEIEDVFEEIPLEWKGDKIVVDMWSKPFDIDIELRGLGRLKQVKISLQQMGLFIDYYLEGFGENIEEVS